MKFFYSYDIQFLFLDYFKKNNHKILDPCSIIPPNDKSLLFTNSGMVQFKDFFLGNKKVIYKNIATSQPCIRVGGKHNDLSNVGYTFRHHTSFNMLGNFSFGGYFKNDAIFYAWYFLTCILHIHKKKLFITVYENDSESDYIWLNVIKIKSENLVKLGKKDNFWMMGNYGPCGPCTEIFYDNGDFLNGIFDNNGNFLDRYIEIWNIVFMEFNFCENGFEKLNICCVDTGMGLERISAVAQGVFDNYEIKVFKDLKNLIVKVLSENKSFIYNNCFINIISDHLRTIFLMICCGIVPANDGRSYVLRKIIRRASIYGKKLNIFGPFLYKLSNFIILNLECYNFLLKFLKNISTILFEEESKFGETLNNGLRKLDELILLSSGKICGKDAFVLYDTYGFPIELTIEILKEHGLNLNIDEFYDYMFIQKNNCAVNNSFYFSNVIENKDCFKYDTFKNFSNILKIVVDGVFVNVVDKFCKCILILDNSIFYYESGGQIGDKGFIFNNSFVFLVENVLYLNGLCIHFGFLKFGYMKIGDSVKCCIDFQFRKKIASNHSATHIVNCVLKKNLSEKIKQVGSYIDDNRLRFDFLFDYILDFNELNIEFLVNKYIFDNLPVKYDFIDFSDAKSKNIVYLDNDKYSDKVRVVYIGDFFSSELCSGTHVSYSGEIGLFKILSFSSIASGVKRLEAVTGFQSLSIIQNKFKLLNFFKIILKCEENFLENRIRNLLFVNDFLSKKIFKLKKNFIFNMKNDILKKMLLINNIKLLLFYFFFGDINLLKEFMIDCNKVFLNDIVVFASVEDDIVNVIINVDKKLEYVFNAFLMMKYFFIKIGGYGGGDKFCSIGGYKNYKNNCDINFILNSNLEFISKCLF